MLACVQFYASAKMSLHRPGAFAPNPLSTPFATTLHGTPSFTVAGICKRLEERFGMPICCCSPLSGTVTTLQVKPHRILGYLSSCHKGNEQVCLIPEEEANNIPSVTTQCSHIIGTLGIPSGGSVVHPLLVVGMRSLHPTILRHGPDRQCPRLCGTAIRLPPA
jgi:hypothetical protein